MSNQIVGIQVLHIKNGDNFAILLKDKVDDMLNITIVDDVYEGVNLLGLKHFDIVFVDCLETTSLTNRVVTFLEKLEIPFYVFFKSSEKEMINSIRIEQGKSFPKEQILSCDALNLLFHVAS